MNPHRKCVNWHITYVAHYVLPLPGEWKYKFLGYCYEIGGEN